MLGEAVDQQDQRDHHRHDADHQPGEAVEPQVEAGLDPFARDRSGHAAEIGLHPRCYHDRSRCPALNARSHEAYVLEFSGGGHRLSFHVMEFSPPGVTHQ